MLSLPIKLWVKWRIFLALAQFLRIHKSYIVSVTNIKAVFGNSVDMGKSLLPIGLIYKEAVMSLIAGKSSGF
jgi:hypothetical protein